jgi:adenylosuccinate synthase
MARQAKAVIGANYGDEGKGLMTDFLTAETGRGTLVVRANGGAQAGHTVTTPDGHRHVFSHFAAGSYLGARSYLSRFFVVNPILFLRERFLLERQGVTPAVSVAPQALVTTPYDMIINQTVEAARGQARHGSCGVGFGETIERTLSPALALTMADLGNRDRLMVTLKAIRTTWVERRLHALGCGERWAAVQPIVSSDELLYRFVDDCESMLKVVTLADSEIIRSAEAVVFEGAQGLLLDQDRGAFPHVTRSNTGLRNVVALAKEAGLNRLEVTYATRAYLTRHGAGPLAFELPAAPYAGIDDATNVDNPYQGTLRFAWLNLDTLANAIQADLADGAGLSIEAGVAVTCLDQVPAIVTWATEGGLENGSREALLDAVAVHTTLPVTQISQGPTRAAITRLAPNRRLRFG